MHVSCLEGSYESLKTLLSCSYHLLQHIEMYSCDLQMASLGVSAKDNVTVINVECDVYADTESDAEDRLADTQQEEIPFLFIDVKREVEEPWAGTSIKEEQIDEIRKGEKVLSEGDDQLSKEDHLDALQFHPSLRCDQKHIIKDDINSKDMNLIYTPTVTYGDNLNSGGQKMNRAHSELKSNQITGNENEIKHRTTVNDRENYKCDICSKYFEGEKFRSHQCMPSRKRTYKCELCNKFFSRRGGLHKHQRLHAGDKRYRCNSCSKCFVEKSHLDRHERTHTGEKPFKCDVCNSVFTQKGSLNIHRRTHSGEKLFKCDICNNYFTSSSYLVVHQRIHTGEKPFTCDYCNKSFRCRSKLKIHIRTHAKDGIYFE